MCVFVFIRKKKREREREGRKEGREGREKSVNEHVTFPFFAELFVSTFENLFVFAYCFHVFMWVCLFMRE